MIANLENNAKPSTVDAKAGTKILISQKDNYLSNYGDVLRSSAIFYYRYNTEFDTTISFMNYWKAKRNLSIAVCASVRDMSGRLVRREKLNFDNANVINYRPRIVSQESFEGSVEIEVFTLENMVIPYSAIMAVYKTSRGISMVHSYARTYSRHEVEEGRCISIGEEACWTLRDDEACSSFAVFHNGGVAVPPQDVELVVTNYSGAVRKATISLGTLSPYQTVRIAPHEHISGLTDFLGNAPGSGSLSFRLGESFTRMLVGNERVDGTDFQITHSNFNYSRHETEHIEDDGTIGYMYVPSIGVSQKEVLVYPDSDAGSYKVELSDQRLTFTSGRSLTFQCDNGLIRFSKDNGAFPARIVTAISGRKQTDVLPFECSLGVHTKARPLKRFWWGIIGSGKDLESRLIVYDMKEIYGPPSDADTLLVKMYSACHLEVLEKSIPIDGLHSFDKGVSLVELFPEANEFLGNDLGYFTLFSQYGGLICFSTLEKSSGSISFEHAF